MAAVSAAVMAATASSYAGNHAARKAAEALTRRAAEDREPEAAVVLHTKCPGCGSFEFEMHGRRSVCSYCRTPKIG